MNTPTVTTFMQYRSKAVLRMPRLCTKTGRSRAGLYELMNPRSPRHDPTFPRPIALGPRSRGWIEEEIDQWIEAKAAQRG